MTNHPNRSKRSPSPARHPTPDEVKATRLAAGMTQTDAARSIHCTLTTWQRWEYGDRKMHPAMWELFKIKTQEK